MSRRRTRFRSTSSSSCELPLAISPAGRSIGADRRLPSLPSPKKIVVCKDALWVDGWIVRLLPLARETMSWFAEQVARWAREDSSPQNKAQVLGVIDAVETLIKNESEKDKPKQGEFEF